MGSQLCVYEVTRHYIYDNATLLDDSLKDRILGMCRARDFKGLAGLSGELDAHGSSVHLIRIVRQVSAFFKKNADFSDDAVCTDAALASFNRGEKLCRITNRRLDHYYLKRDRIDPDLQLWLSRAEQFIKNCLGSYDDFISEIPSLLKVTSGATALSARSDSLPFQKLKRTIDICPGTRPYLEAAYRFYGYTPPKVKVVPWNRVELVPKNWKTHRSIACEPSGSMPFQLAFDQWVKRKLRRKGYDLRDQSRNQEYARIGSINGDFATIDLSMASDTLAYNTVAWLLPQPWFQYLCDHRSPMYRTSDGKVHKYAKFSSMGNGATFGLETLVFASILHAVGSTEDCVYGDDIIVATEHYPKVLKMLKFLGFVPNEEKSYASGPFRESCGKDYFNGRDVTPFYIRSTSDWDKPNLCHNVNGLVKTSEFGSLWEYLMSIIFDNRLPLVPYTYDTQLGVHVHPHYAYKLKLIQTRRRQHMGVLMTKGYVRKDKPIRCFDSRALFLWHFQKSTVGEPRWNWKNQCYEDVCVESSRYSASAHRFVRKWVAWSYPGMGTAELFNFSATLYPRIADREV